MAADHFVEFAEDRPGGEQVLGGAGMASSEFRSELVRSRKRPSNFLSS
jgi:hypothetical protein